MLTPCFLTLNEGSNGLSQTVDSTFMRQKDWISGHVLSADKSSYVMKRTLLINVVLGTDHPTPQKRKPLKATLVTFYVWMSLHVCNMVKPTIETVNY
ncbi:hypothetical protein PROFUN_16057 [Planoprotostelium fungivorum]|uniref:Uncharacterized protein n=1 Tax=Planoprotostelium fungivorum TaxID=1890364 RepID=A0A2P6MXH8_9EUKA|nr:hypothetical protein PROFUN_16057 [Planoprotostelium fungivorum]